MRSVDRREIGDSVSEVEELELKRWEPSDSGFPRLDWTEDRAIDARSSRMSPTDLSWFQGCFFFVLGFAASYGLNRCQNRRTNYGISDVELSSIRVENGIATILSDDAQSSGSDEEARSPSTPVGEAMASTGPLSCPDRNRLRSESLKRPGSLLEPSAETRKTSHFMEFVTKTEVPNFARIEMAYSTTAADRTPSLMSSTTAGLFRPSGGEDEALSHSDPLGEAMALTGTPSCPDRRSNSCNKRNRTKSSFEKVAAKDKSRNVGRAEPANMIVADSFSTSMTSTTTVVRRPPRRHPSRQSVPKPPRKIPSVDHLQASTLDGLHRRPRISQGPSGEATKYRGIRYKTGRRKWVAEMKPQNSKNKYTFGDFESDLQAAFAIDAAFFYYEEPHLTNFLQSSPAMVTMLSPMPAGLDDKGKLLFVRDKAKRLAKYAADNLEVLNPSLDKGTQ